MHQLEIVERLIRHGVYMGPLNMAITCYGGGGCGYNPFDWMEFIRRTPQGAIATFWAGMRISAVAQPMAIVLGQHVRVGNEDNLWNSKRAAHHDGSAGRGDCADFREQFGRKVATAEEARKIMKIGVTYNSVEETLQNLGLPPNRAGGERGFMVWETDGKKSVAHADVRLASDGLLHGAAGDSRARESENRSLTCFRKSPASEKGAGRCGEHQT